MSEPVEHTTSAPDPGAGRFWEQYVSAGSGRDRSRSAPEAEAANGAGAEPGAGRPERDGTSECLDWCPICRGAEILRFGAPPELRAQLHAVQRDSLMVLRALIDAHLQRRPMDADSGSGDVEDASIP